MEFDEISKLLLENYNVQVSRTTLWRQIKAWDIVRRPQVDEETKAIAKIQIAMLYHLNFSDLRIQRALRMDGIGMFSPHQIARWRRETGIKRWQSSYEIQQQQDFLEALIRKEIEERNISGYGATLLVPHMRRLRVQASRRTLLTTVRLVNPEGVARRAKDAQRVRGEYITPGPDYLWSVDGHDKLALWGFQIYAAIDAYSRNIIWIYVGTSSDTSISVGRQFLRVCHAVQRAPRFIRADRGEETGIMMEVHYANCRENNPGIPWNDCFLLGTSVHNQRIESWWGQLQKSRLYQWRSYFKQLSQASLFTKCNADLIAISAIYFPHVQHAANQYMYDWNQHQIRAQKERPHCIPGIPDDIYNYHEGNRYHQPIQTAMFEAVERELDYYDIHEYLPEQTLVWCRAEVLAFAQVDLEKLALSDCFENGRILHKHIYLELRRRLAFHIASGANPQLQQTAKPEGGIPYAKTISPTFATIAAANFASASFAARNSNQDTDAVVADEEIGWHMDQEDLNIADL